MTDRSDDRMTALEMRVSHQEITIEDLSATVASQWRRIDALASELARTRDRIAEVLDRAPSGTEPPPHY